MAKGIKRMVRIARANVQEEISGYIASSGEGRSNFFARGLSGEGFNGGYRAALDDVIIALNGGVPNRNGWWSKPEDNNEH